MKESEKKQDFSCLLTFFSISLASFTIIVVFRLQYAVNWKKMEEKYVTQLVRSLFLLQAHTLLGNFASVVSTDVFQLSGFCLFEKSRHFVNIS